MRYDKTSYRQTIQGSEPECSQSVKLVTAKRISVAFGDVVCVTTEITHHERDSEKN